MQFDLEVIRAIVTKASELARGERWPVTALHGYSHEVVLFNLQEAFDEGLVSGRFSANGTIAILFELTSRGRAFLEFTKTSTDWDTAISQVWKQNLPMTVKSVFAVFEGRKNA